MSQVTVGQVASGGVQVPVPVHSTRVVAPGDYGALGILAAQAGFTETDYNTLMASLERVTDSEGSRAGNEAKRNAVQASNAVILAVLPGLLRAFAQALQQERMRVTQAIEQGIAAQGSSLRSLGGHQNCIQIVRNVALGGSPTGQPHQH